MTKLYKATQVKPAIGTKHDLSRTLNIPIREINHALRSGELVNGLKIEEIKTEQSN